MDPTKPKPAAVKPGNNLTRPQQKATAAPKTSFEAALKTKLEEAVDPDREAKTKAAEEQLALQLVRQVLYAPKAAKIQIDRADDPNNE